MKVLNFLSVEINSQAVLLNEKVIFFFKSLKATMDFISEIESSNGLR